MTMKLRNDFDVTRPTLDPAKHYRYTWPGQAPKVVSGAALSALIKGANPELLDIHETDVSERPTDPETLDKDNDKDPMP